MCVCEALLHGYFKLAELAHSNTRRNRFYPHPIVTLHRLLLAVRDRRDDAAETLLHDVTQPMTKKKYPFEANTIFLTALANRMEKVACMLLDRGFPPDVNAPVFTMKPTKKYAEFMPFRMNTALFPSYFLVAVAMNFEMLVKFMIKVG